MSTEEPVENQDVEPPVEPSGGGSEPENAAVPERDTSSSSPLLSRLEALSPVVDDRHGASVRVEVLTTSDELRSRLHYWRALVAAAVTPNPWLEPASVFSYLEIAALQDNARLAPRPSFLVLWHDSGAEDPFRDRRMICLLAFTPARWGTEGLLSAALGWRPPGGLATPLVHRHHQRAVASAISHWLKTGESGFRLLTLEGSGPRERWRTELQAAAQAAGVQLETIGDAPDCVMLGGWSELFILGNRGRREPRAIPPDIEVLTPVTVDAETVSEVVALECVWEGRVRDDGRFETDWLTDLRYAHFQNAALEGRLFVARTTRDGRIRAQVVAVKSGPDVVIAGTAADPSLAEDDRTALIRRAVTGLQARIATYAGVVRVRTGPYADDPLLADLFDDRLERDSVTLSLRRMSVRSVWPRFLRRA